MKIIIVGCGKIGTTIVASLTREGHDVIAVDRDQAIVEELTNLYDVMAVCGNGADNDTLSEAGIERCDLFVAVTGSDENNMLSCFLARRMGAKHTIARIRNPEYNDQSLGYLCEQLELSMAINPDLLAAHELYNILRLPSALRIETFARGSFELVELVLKPDSPLDGMSLADIRRRFKDVKFLICAVSRGDELIIPAGSFVLRAGDRIALTAHPNEIVRLLRQMGQLQKSARRVMLVGGSRIAYYLSRMLIASGHTVKLIEQDRTRCQTLCAELTDAVIICGDGARQEVLLEEGLGDMDAFVTLTGSDEANILLSIYAGQQKVPKVIAKVNRPEHAAMADRLGLDCIVSPRNIISDRLSSYARAIENAGGSKIESLYKILDDRAEALEFLATAEFTHANRPLRELHPVAGILIAGIIRGRQIIIPSGEDVILPGDRVIVLSAEHRLSDLGEIVG